jgi:hypothetical protein
MNLIASQNSQTKNPATRVKKITVLPTSTTAAFIRLQRCRKFTETYFQIAQETAILF